MKVSICIPTYEMAGNGYQYLKFSLDKRLEQTYTNVEVVISDHSDTSEIFNLCQQYQNQLDIKYIKNKNNRGNSSANLNNGLKNCSGDVIKILFQDDFFYDKHSLSNQVSIFTSGWLVTACCHFDGLNFFNPFYPKYNDKIQYGNNTISSPSVLMIKNKDLLYFDENLIWLMDVDYYKRLFTVFGEPTICSRINVVNRQHNNQLTNLIPEDLKTSEYNYIVKKYSNE